MGAIALFVLLLVAGSIPYTTPAAPDWDVTVVDSSGDPIKGVLVREVYRNYSAESEGHEVDQTSDAGGHVHFARQVTRASRLQRAFETISSAMALTHASFGPTAYVLVFRDAESAMATLGDQNSMWTGSPSSVKSKVILK